MAEMGQDLIFSCPRASSSIINTDWDSISFLEILFCRESVDRDNKPVMSSIIMLFIMSLVQTLRRGCPNWEEK